MSTPTMRRLRHNKVEMSPLTIERETFVHDDGRLTQEMGLYADGNILMSTEWILALRGSHDEPLRGCDHHWKNLKREFQETMEQASDYQHLKQDPGENTRDTFMRLVARTLSSSLFEQPMRDEEFATANYRESIGPELSLSERFAIMRQFVAGEKNASTAKLDKFEKIIEVIGERRDRATTAYRKVSNKMEEHGFNAATGDSGDDDEAWRGGDVHPPANRNDGQSQQTELDKAFERYCQSLISFTDAANSLWLMASKQVEKHEKVTVNTTVFEIMKSMKKDEQEVYDALKEAARASGIMHELTPVFDRLDGEKKNIQEIMQLAISMASRPKELENEIRNALPQERGK